MTCSSCGRENPGEARFCANCGSPLEPGCPSCGAALPEEARFCPSCGRPVQSEPGTPSLEERKLVTVLFADLVGSTPLGEQLDTENFREVTSEYFRAMRGEVEAEGGTVGKYIGDAIMAVFGAPVAHEDDPSRTLRAALRMHTRLDELNPSLRERYGVELEMRIGVNTGEVIASGTADPAEGLVTGDAVNVAARLEQRADPGGVLVGARTARGTRGFRFGPAIELELKGKEHPVTALPLLGRTDTSAEDGAVPGIRAPLVGRDTELDVLATVWRRVTTERRPHLVTLYGEPGVGKSRLTREFLERAERGEPRPLVLRGRCLPYGEGITYWPLAEVLKSVAGVLDTDAPDAALTRIRQSVASLLAGSGVDAATSALAYTVGLEDPSADLRQLPPREIRRAVDEAWRALFTALATDRPTALVVEDIHWADAAMLDLLEDVADRVDGPFLILCPARPELTERRPGWGGGRRSYSSITLDPLSRSESDRLIGFLLEVSDLPTALRDRILERAEGNPFFLEEIVRQLIDEGRIVRSGGGWRATKDAGDVVIPDKVQGVLSARIDLLSPEQKRAVQTAAVVGRVFWTGPVARLLNGASGHVEELLRDLEDRELVSSRVRSSIAGDREYIFKHILTRDVAYESLPRRERGPAHATIARWLEEVVGERRREFSELLAYHYLEAYRLGPGSAEDDLRSSAFEYLLLAAEDARTKLALTRAKQLCSDALELAAGSPEREAVVHELRGRVAVEESDGDGAWLHFRTAADLRIRHLPNDLSGIARTCGVAVEVPTRMPGTMSQLPDEEIVRPYLTAGLEAAGNEDSTELARLLAAQAFWPFSFPGTASVRGSEAKLGGQRAVEMAERLDHPFLLSVALDGMASHFIQDGIYGPTVPLNDRRLELLPRLRDPFEASDVYAVAAWTWHHIGRYVEAERLATAGYESLAGGTLGGSLHCLAWRIVARARLGRWDEVLEDYEVAQQILGGRRPPGFAQRLHGAVAFVQEIRGNRTESDRALRAVLEDSDVGKPATVFGAVGWVGLVFGHRGEFETAHLWLDRQEASPFQVNLGLIHEARCDLLADEGRWDLVPALAARARAHAEESGLEALPIFVDRMEARAAVAEGDLEAGIDGLRSVRERFAALQARWDEALTALHRAEALAAAGRRPDSDGDVTIATSTFDRLGARHELDRARTLA